MSDLLYAVLALVLFSISRGLLALCVRLMEG
jgi:hypothetical protein